MRKGWRIVRGIVAALVILLATALLLFQVPFVQTWAARSAVSLLEEKIQADISFSKIHLRPFNTLVVKDLVILDKHAEPSCRPAADTVFSAGNLSASFSLKGLFNKEGIHLSRVQVRDASLILVTTGRQQTNLKRLLGGGKKDRERPRDNQGRLFDIKKAELDNLRFRLVNTFLDKDFGNGINWSDLDVKAGHLSTRDIAFADGDLTATLLSGDILEKSGCRFTELSGKVKVGHGETIVSSLHLKDALSELRDATYTMRYDSDRDFVEYVDKVRMSLAMKDSRLDLSTLAWFAPALRGKGLTLQLEDVDAEGTVNNLFINRLAVHDPESGVSAVLSGRLRDAAEKTVLKTEMEVEELVVTAAGLGQLVQSFSPGTTLSLDKFAPGHAFTFGGKVSGPMDGLRVTGDLLSDVGSLSADLLLSGLTGSSQGLGIGGHLETKDLDVGQIALVNALGPCSLKGDFNAAFGNGGPVVEIDTLLISRLRLLDYDYSQIIGTGTYSEKAFDGRIVSKDPNLQFLFQGLFSLSDQTRNGVYKYYASLGYADLEALHLDKRGISKASGQIRANFMTVNRGDLTGEIRGTDIFLENESGRHEVGDILVRAHNNESINRINLTSSFADGRFLGGKSPAGLLEDLHALESGKVHSGSGYECSVSFHDSRDILSFILPGLYVADSTEMSIKLTPEGQLRASVSSPRLAFGKNNAKGLRVVARNDGGPLSLLATATSLQAASIQMQADTLRLDAKGDSLKLRFTYDNGSDLLGNGRLDLAGKAVKMTDGRTGWKGDILPSVFTVEGRDWLLDAADFSILGKDLAFDAVSLHSNEQHIRLDGGFSQEKPDTLSLELEHFNLGILNGLLKQDLGIAASATGKAVLTSPWKSDRSRLLMHLQCDSTRLGGKEVGTLQLASSLDERKDRLRLLARNDLHGQRTLDVQGYYYLQRKALDVEAGLDRFNAGYFAPLLETVFSRMEGGVSGSLHASGPLSRLEVTSRDARLDDVLLEVAFTRVPYRVDGPFHIDSTGVHFDQVKLSDLQEGSGTASGGIRFRHLKDFAMNTVLSFNRMKCLQTHENDNPTFYGDLSGSGTLRITGPFHAIQLDADVRTADGGNLHVPVDNARGDTNNDLLTFKEPLQATYQDPYERMMSQLDRQTTKKSDFGLHLKVRATPGVNAFVEVDRSSGNVLSANGNGTLDLDVRPGRDYFAINGEYALRSGHFHFNAMDIAVRDFMISDGSAIRFNGDIMDSDLNIKGLYTTKASIATLIADTVSVSSRRAVNCGIEVTGKLREPVLRFSIDIPDLDPTTQSRVQAALNTEDKVQRQLIALLISGGFLPDEQSGIVNNTSMLYANVAEVMAGQLNNILQKLEIPLDLGLNYQAADNGTNIFDVAVSTQLLGDRVLVNGAFGNKAYGSGATTDIAGDLDIEIKLDPPGRYRLTLFSHSVDDYTSSLDNSQRNGLGIAFQQEFNSFRALVRSLTAGRKKKEQMREEAATAERKVKTIIIDEESEKD